MCERVRPSGDTCGDLTAGAGAPGRRLGCKPAVSRAAGCARTATAFASGDPADPAAVGRRARRVVAEVTVSRFVAPDRVQLGWPGSRFSRFSTVARDRCSPVCPSRGLGVSGDGQPAEPGSVATAPITTGVLTMRIGNANRLRRGGCPATNPGAPCQRWLVEPDDLPDELAQGVPYSTSAVSWS